MGRLKALTYASVLALGAAQAAHAADLLPPPPPLDAPLRGPVDEPGGFYVRVDGGLANNYASGLRSTFSDGGTLQSQGAVVGASGVAVGDSSTLGLGFGYQFNNWFRADITGEYRTAANYSSYINAQWDGGLTGCNVGNAAKAYCSDQYKGQVKTGLVLVNGYLDMGTWAGFTPYIGAGLGFAAYQTSGVTDTTQFPLAGNNAWGNAPAYTGVNFAWALTTGVSYHITPNLLIDANYRYVNMGSFQTGVIACDALAYCHGETQHFNMAANDVRVGLRWLAAAPVVYDVPVIAKF